jgi:hypothetical protein
MSLLIVVFFLYNFFGYNVSNLNGPVVRASGLKANEQSANLTKALKEFVCLGISYSSLIQVFINPAPPPPQLLL